MLLRLAWRNLRRNPGRSVITLGAVAVVVTLTLTFFSLAGAARNGIYTSVTRTAGHLQVHAANYRQARDFRDRLIDDAGAIVTALDEALPDAEFTLALAVPGLIESNEDRSYGILLQGLELPDAAKERYLAEFVAQGELPAMDDVEGIALGDKLAANLQVGLGDTVYLYAPGTDGYGAAAYDVRAILDVPNSQGTALLSLRAAQELAAPGAINRLEILFPQLVRSADDSALAALEARARAALPEGYSLERWSVVNPDLAGFIAYFRRVSLIITVIFFVLAGLLVANTVYLSVIERVREFGIIISLGTPRSKVVLMVLSESVLLGLGGAAIGLVVGSLIVALSARGVSFPGEVRDFLVEQGLPRVFHGSVSPREFAFTIGFTLVTATTAALLPALSAARLEPVEAMRFRA